MLTMTYTDSRAHYAQALAAATDDRQEVVITRAGKEPAVIIALEEYEALRETAYLMRSPANARHLLDAVARDQAGGGAEHALIESE